MNIANLLLRITGDNADARRSLREVAAEVRNFARQEANARLGVEGAENAKRQIGELERALSIIGQRDVKARVRVDVDQARARLSLLRRELEHSLSGGAGARPVHAVMQDIEGVGGAIARMGGAGVSFFTRLGAAAGEAATSIGGALAGGVARLGSAMGGALLQAIGQIVAQFAAWVLIGLALLPVISAVVAVVAALAASLAAAVAGAGILAVALGGALLPIIGVLVFAFARFAKIVQAAQQAEQERAAQADRIKAADQARRQAVEQLESAERSRQDAIRGVHDAEERLSQATVEGYRAQRDAVEGVKDAELAREGSLLGLQHANLQVDEAKSKLKDFATQAGQSGHAFEQMWARFKDVSFDAPQMERILHRARLRPTADQTAEDPFALRHLILDVADAYHNRKEAQDGVHDSTVDLNDAQATNNRFVRQGLNAYEPYRQAVRGLADAKRTETDATRNLRRQQEALSEATRKAREEHGKLSTAMQQLSPQERRAARDFEDLSNAFKEAMGPVTHQIIEGILEVLRAVTDTIKDPAVHDALNALGGAIRGFFGAIARELRRPETRDIFVHLIRGAGRLVGILGSRAAISFFRILLRLADEALGPLTGLARRFANWIERIEEGTGRTRRFHNRVKGLIGSFETWWGVAKQLARIVINFIKDAKGDGDNLAESIRRVFKRFADFLDTDEGRRRVKQWLRDAKQLFIDVYNTIKEWLPVLRTAGHILKGIVDAIRFVMHHGNLSRFLGGGDDPAAQRGFSNYQRELTRLQQEAADPDLSPARRRWARRRAHQLAKSAANFGGFQLGGLIPGLGGFGDDQLIGAEGGEYMIRRSVVDSLGTGFFDAINAGASPAAVAGGGTHIGQIVMHTVGGGTFHPKVAAVELGRELTRRGS